MWAIVCGSVAFGIAVIVIIAHYFPRCGTFCLTSGNLVEGITLAFLVIWWVFGVAFQTLSGGIAYTALNIYYSGWLALAATLFTFNSWIVQRAGVDAREGFLGAYTSKTLLVWWALLFTSVVVLGSAADGFSKYKNNPNFNSAQYSWAISVGTVSAFFSLLVISAHYSLKMMVVVCPGGLVELIIAFLLIIWWAVCLSLSLSLSLRLLPLLTYRSLIFSPVWSCSVDLSSWHCFNSWFARTPTWHRGF
jgi:hypothetical protein